MQELRKDRMLLKGAIDIHVHIDPDLRAPFRAQNALECAKMMKEAGMRAVIYKPLGLPTTAMAYMVNLLVDDFLAYGSIVLNRCVGGLNPVAVRHALIQGQGAKAVWFPTADSVLHTKFFDTGTYPFAPNYSKGLKKERSERFEAIYALIRTKPEDAVKVIENGKLIDAAKEIMDVVAEYDVMLGTGHMSNKDAFVFVEEAKAAGVKKIVITHPAWEIMKFSFQDMQELASMGVYIEHCASVFQPQEYVSHGFTPIDPNDYAQWIRAIGAEHTIMSTDCGMFSTPVPVEAMRTFIALMLDAGITEKEVDIMVRKNPAKLLDLPE